MGEIQSLARGLVIPAGRGTGECAHLAIVAQAQALYIDQAESPSALPVTTGVGTLAPLYCTAFGKVLLAFGKAPIPSELKSFTLRTMINWEMIQRYLDQVRSQGYAVDDEEYDYGVGCIAVPVYDYRDKCVAAIGISGPSNRLTHESLPGMAQIVLETGKALSSRHTRLLALWKLLEFDNRSFGGLRHGKVACWLYWSSLLGHAGPSEFCRAESDRTWYGRISLWIISVFW